MEINYISFSELTDFIPVLLSYRKRVAFFQDNYFYVEIVRTPFIFIQIKIQTIHSNFLNYTDCVISSVADPEPDPDPHVFGPPGSGSTSHMYGSGSCSGSGSFYHRAKIVRKTLIPTIFDSF
jgi:hypothetical protein